MKICKDEKQYAVEDEYGSKLVIELYNYKTGDTIHEQRINIVMDNKDSDKADMLEEADIVFDAPLKEFKRALMLIESNEKRLKNAAERNDKNE